ncbi:uncharacterized protein LOC110919004 [Helianthus annuus]|uniref:uncharacterized protein LOC110919004 n=1 Tax=Helianthus annuus TaxID=4232 RepID=UPI000B900D6D|nr:uncharacterized protein LOC110919004 [Helianthus annuus]
MEVTSKRKAQSSRRARHVIVRPQVHGVENVGVQATNQVYNMCTNCNEIGHTAEVCLVGMVEEQVEEVNAIQGGSRNFDMHSNTYHPGLRNHPNFRYRNPANQANPNFQGAQGNFAPCQQYNQGNYRGGNNFGYQGQFQQSGGHSGSSGQTSSSGNEVMEMLKAMQLEMQRRNQMGDVRMQKDEIRDKAIQSLTTQMGQLASEVAILKKGSCQLQSDAVTNSKNIKSVNINVVSTVPSSEFNETFLTSSCQVSAGMGKDAGVENDKEHGVPLMPIRVGKLKIPHALLDYGAGMSMLSGELYDMYDFGPLQDVDTMVSLADESWRRPRGMVRNVKIQLGEFEYPVDFLVLDYASTKMAAQQRVILGRPFLYTANAQINCRDGIITMTEKNRKLSFDVQTRVISYESIEGKGGESSDCMKNVCQRMKINHPPNREETHTGSSRSVFDYPPNRSGTDAFYTKA